jgi:phenylalanyl-tRNA synthetase alpha subunit
MSHYASIAIQCKDEEALIRALMRVKTVNGHWNKGMIEVHKEATSLYGYHGDKRAQKANIVIRRQFVQGAANDIGFERQADGTFKAWISEFDSSFYNATWQQELMTYYGVEVAKAEAEKQGHTVKEYIDEKKRICLDITYNEVKKNKASGGVQIVNW